MLYWRFQNQTEKQTKPKRKMNKPNRKQKTKKINVVDFRDLAKSENVYCWATSAKIGHGINEVFDYLHFEYASKARGAQDRFKPIVEAVPSRLNNLALSAINFQEAVEMLLGWVKTLKQEWTKDFSKEMRASIEEVLIGVEKAREEIYNKEQAGLAHACLDQAADGFLDVINQAKLNSKLRGNKNG